MQIIINEIMQILEISDIKFLFALLGLFFGIMIIVKMYK